MQGSYHRQTKKKSFQSWMQKLVNFACWGQSITHSTAQTRHWALAISVIFLSQLTHKSKYARYSKYASNQDSKAQWQMIFISSACWTMTAPKTCKISLQTVLYNTISKLIQLIALTLLHKNTSHTSNCSNCTTLLVWAYISFCAGSICTYMLAVGYANYFVTSF